MTTEPAKKHAPRAVINRLLDAATALERESALGFYNSDPQSVIKARANMDLARSLTVAAKWLEEGK